MIGIGRSDALPQRRLHGVLAVLALSVAIPSPRGRSVTAYTIAGSAVVAAVLGPVYLMLTGGIS